MRSGFSYSSESSSGRSDSESDENRCSDQEGDINSEEEDQGCVSRYARMGMQFKRASGGSSSKGGDRKRAKTASSSSSSAAAGAAAAGGGSPSSAAQAGKSPRHGKNKTSGASSSELNHANPKKRLQYACSHFAKSTVSQEELANPCAKCIARAGAAAAPPPQVAPSSTTTTASSHPTRPSSSSRSSSQIGGGGGGGNNNKTTSSGTALNEDGEEAMHLGLLSSKTHESFADGMERRLREVASYARSFSSESDSRCKTMQEKMRAKDAEIARLKANRDAEIARLKQEHARNLSAKNDALRNMRTRLDDADEGLARLRACVKEKVPSLPSFSLSLLCVNVCEWNVCVNVCECVCV